MVSDVLFAMNLANYQKTIIVLKMSNKEVYIVRTSRRRRHRSSWINFVVTIAFALISLLLVFIIINKSLNRADSLNVIHTATIDSAESSYPGIKIITESSNDERAPYAVQYPQSEFTDFNEKVKEYISTAKDEYLLSLEKGIGELNISFETFYHPSGYYSFIFFKNSYVGGANSAIEVNSFHLNPQTGKSIDITALLNNDEKQLVKLAQRIREVILNDPSLEGHLFLEEVAKATEPSWDNFKNFALTEKSLRFYFDQYKIASGVTGTPVITLAISETNELLAKEFQTSVVDIVSHHEKSELNVPTKETEQGLEQTPTTEPKKEQPPASKPDKNVKKVALTFDDGPDPKTTPQILETLKKYDAKATFFMLGSRVEYYPDIAKRIHLEGHELGNHTWTHSNLTKAKPDKIKNEVAKTSAIIEKVTGAQATVFRPPYGAINQTVRTHIDLPVILWSVDTLDWKYRSSSHLLESVKKHTKDGSIILMHDIHQATANGLDAVLAHLQSEGYTFVTVSELGLTH